MPNTNIDIKQAAKENTSLIDSNGMIRNYLLSVVIINYKTPELTINCIASLLPELEDVHAIVHIVDNSSSDGSVDKIKHWLISNDKYSKINLIESSVNLGFSGGNNLGINAANANYYLLLNSDTMVREGSIKRLLSEADEHPHAGLISPRLEWPDGTPQKSCFRYHTPLSEFLSAARTSLITKFFKNHEIALPVSDLAIHPEWTSFACVLIRKNVFDDIGLMDDGYFMYYEDSDYCYHAKKVGWDILHTPSSRVVHLRGGSSPVKESTQLQKRLPRYYYESRSRYFFKLYGRFGLTLANLLWLSGRIISRFREYFGSKQSHVCEKQWLDIWTNYWNPLLPFKTYK